MPTHPSSFNQKTNLSKGMWLWFSNLNLRLKLMAAFLIVTALAVGVVALLTDRVTRAELTRQAGTNLSVIAAREAADISQMIEKEVDTLKAVTLNKLVQDAAEAANEANLDKLSQIERLDQQWRAADSAANDADPLVASVNNNAVAIELREFRAAFPQHIEMFVTDRYGLNVASTNRTSDYYQADEAWWQVAYNNGQGGVYIGQPDFDDSAGVYAINIALPLPAQDRSEIVGVLRTTLNIEVLTTILVAGRFGQTGRTDIYLPDGRKIMLETPDQEFELKIVEQQLDPELAAQFSQGPAYFEGFHNEQPSLLAGAVPGITYEAGRNNRPEIAQLGWLVVVSQQRAEALQPVETATRTTLLVALGTLIAVGLLALAVAQLLAVPITRLTRVVAQIAEGDLNAQALVESGDEIGSLAATFNNMTAQLRETMSSLEQRVAERTHGLELAAEVGRQLATMRDLDRLLAEAVELIRSRFDLYYTQIYLVDVAGRSLVLRAGTGVAGEQLLRRGHRLRLGPGSINGTAAAEKRPVILANTEQSAAFLSNPLLPHTRSGMAVPLLVGDQVVGVLNMQHDQPNRLTEENLPAFEALAGQLAIAIENARLFAEAERARANTEAYARRLTRQGWDEFFNAVDHPEWLGFTYTQGMINPLDRPLAALVENEGVLAMPVTLSGEPVGLLQLEAEPGRSWTATETELINIVVEQATQQVENLRLLAQAEQYRVETEQAASRLTREGWAAYIDSLAPTRPGFVYNLNKVIPLNGTAPSGALTLTHPITVRGETIGELAIGEAGELSDEAAELLAIVAEQLSDHIENARLLEETERGRRQTEEKEKLARKQNQILLDLTTSERLAQGELELALEEITRATALALGTQRASIWFFNARRTRLQCAKLYEVDKNSYSAGAELEAQSFPAYFRALMEKNIIAAHNAHTDPDTSEFSAIYLTPLGINSMLDVPIRFRGQTVGVICHEQVGPARQWSLEEQSFALSMADLVAKALEADERKQAEAALAKRAVELQTVAQVTTAASTILETQKLLQSVVDLTKQSFDLYHAHIYLFNEAADKLELAAGAGEAGQQMVAQGWQISLDQKQSLVAQAARSRQGVIANDIRANPHFLPNPLLPETRAEMAVPLLVGDKVLGVLDVQADQINAFTETDLTIQTTLARQIAIALENARLFEESKHTAERLREIDRLKSEFLANMSHELRTPLNSIIGYSEMILLGISGEISQETAVDVKAIFENGKHLLRLISDILDLAKIEAGRLTLKIEEVSIGALLDDIKTNNAGLLTKKPVELLVNLEQGLPEIEADPLRLNQILNNLVSNAVKFTNEGYVRLHAFRENGWICIDVEDTGIGMSQEDTSKIFEKFMQVDGSYTRRAEGTGLGLAITRHLVHLHGGEINVRSQPGQGTTFTVRLPVD